MRQLGFQDYRSLWEAMQAFTRTRTEATTDEVWLLEHPPTFTQGLNGKPEHLRRAGGIPVIKVDRGGQITYHGPGQIVAYVLLDLHRRNMSVRQLVEAMEQAVIALLAGFHISANSCRDAPGVYVNGAKIAALGLRVRHGKCYHGLSLNVAMDLRPFEGINPCGLPGLAITQLSTLCDAPLDMARVRQGLAVQLAHCLGYNKPVEKDQPSTCPC